MVGIGEILGVECSFWVYGLKGGVLRMGVLGEWGMAWEVPRFVSVLTPIMQKIDNKLRHSTIR